jgi:hypothetical protein
MNNKKKIVNLGYQINYNNNWIDVIVNIKYSL